MVFPWQLVIADDEGDPTKAALIAKKFAESDKVVAIIGPTRTDTGMAAKPTIEQMKIPTFMTVGGDAVIAGGKFGPFHWTFKSPQRTTIAVQKVYAYLKQKGMQKIAILTAADGFGKDGKAALETLAAEYGIKIVAAESFQATDSDMTAQLINIKTASPDAIVCWTIGKAGSIVAKNVKQLGIQVPLFPVPRASGPQIHRTGRKGIRRQYHAVHKTDGGLPASGYRSPEKSHPGVYSFIQDVFHYDRQFPINTHSGYAWDAIYIVANAMKKAGTDNEKLRDAIEKTTGYVGVSGTYNITPEDHNGLGVDSMVLVQISEGQWKLLQ